MPDLTNSNCIYTTQAQCVRKADTTSADTTCDTCVASYPKSGTPLTCNKCGNFLVSTTDNTCTQTAKIANCTASPDDYLHCQTCATGFLPNANMRKCVQNTIANCLYSSDDGTYCAVCATGYVRSSLENLGTAGAVVGAKCHPIVANCVQYNDDSTCAACQLPNYYLGLATATATVNTCILANVDFCVSNTAASASCPKCCDTCASGFGLYAWTVGSVTYNSCVYDSLTCGVANCATYGTFVDWLAATCKLTPVPVPPTSS